MLLDSSIWPKIHGGSTHFPVALSIAAALFESAAFLLPETSSQKPRLHAAGYFAILLAGAGTFPAVLSGLVIAEGKPLGRDVLLLHHLFVWPAFALLAGLAVWRALAGERPGAFGVYLAILCLTAVLTSAAGYWGGELLLNSSAGAAAVASPALVEQGRRFFLASCSHCHGDDARGDEGPDLHGLKISNARIAVTIKRGVKGEMPAFSKKYGDPEIAALTAFVRSLSPGRAAQTTAGKPAALD